MTTFELLASPLSKSLSITWYNNDFNTLLMRLLINLVFLTLVIRYLYYSKTKRKDYLFTYYLIGTITFFLCFGLKKLDIDTGMGLGLFAIFGIIRYRTDAIEIKEMTYLFLIIGISVINALASNQVSISEMALINFTVVIMTYVLEYKWLVKHETRKTINYERIDLIVPEKYDLMKSDLEKRTGLSINRVEVGRIDFLNDTAQVRIYYFADEQTFSDYHVS
jgi:cytochrome c biogenesis factor